MDLFALAALAVLAALWAGAAWYARWCRANGVPAPSSGLDASIAGDGDCGDGGGD